MSAPTAWAQRMARLPEQQGTGLVQWGIAIAVAVIICLPAFVNIRRQQK